MIELNSNNGTFNHCQPPQTTTTITQAKGLLNMPGQNNCFLNSAVQVGVLLSFIINSAVCFNFLF